MLAHVLSSVINGPVARGDFRGVLLGAGGFAALAAFTQITFGFRVVYALDIGELVVRDMRNAIFVHLQGQTAAFFNKMKVGRIISRLSSDLEAIRFGVQDVVFITIVGGGQALFAAILMFRADAVLFCILILWAPSCGPSTATSAAINFPRSARRRKVSPASPPRWRSPSLDPRHPGLRPGANELLAVSRAR